jgi:hypothetical protein
MTKVEFEIKYCKNSGISLKEYYESFITLPCNCGECQGWACVNNDKISIKTHKELC